MRRESIFMISNTSKIIERNIIRDTPNAQHLLLGIQAALCLLLRKWWWNYGLLVNNLVFKNWQKSRGISITLSMPSLAPTIYSERFREIQLNFGMFDKMVQSNIKKLKKKENQN